jgi:N-acetylglucosaminyldiphosphoundecaprenol N-acetyl-beta-D-mannosaminyltransferase
MRVLPRREAPRRTTSVDTPLHVWCRERKRPFLGIGLHGFTRRSFVETLESALARGERLTVTYVNPYYAIEASRDPRLRRLIDRFDIVQADGWGIVYGARLAGVRLPERVAIEDVERPLFRMLTERRARVFLFGAAPTVADAAARTIAAAFPTLSIVGTLHGWWDAERGHPGWFEESDDETIVRTIAASGADVVLVSLPTPLQQEWVVAHASRLGASVVMTVGAYFDHLAEGLDWYPRLLDRAHLDFLYRLYREPSRLWRRYLFGAFTYARLVTDEVRGSRGR